MCTHLSFIFLESKSVGTVKLLICYLSIFSYEKTTYKNISPLIKNYIFRVK